LKIAKYQLLVSIDKELIDRVKQAKDLMKVKNCNRVVNDLLRRGLDALLGTTIPKNEVQVNK
jgi:predicted component of type VI protein secretion system